MGVLGAKEVLSSHGLLDSILWCRKHRGCLASSRRNKKFNLTYLELCWKQGNSNLP